MRPRAGCLNSWYTRTRLKTVSQGITAMIHTFEITLESAGNAEAHDITDQVARGVGRSGMTGGIATIFCPSSTSAVTTIEYESGAVADLRRALDEIAPPGSHYQHNLKWGDGNGHAHLRAALMGPSLTVPFVEGQLMLGTWQQIIFLDFDNRPRKRKLMVQVIGE